MKKENNCKMIFFIQKRIFVNRIESVKINFTEVIGRRLRTMIKKKKGVHLMTLEKHSIDS